MIGRKHQGQQVGGSPRFILEIGIEGWSKAGLFDGKEVCFAVVQQEIGDEIRGLTQRREGIDLQRNCAANVGFERFPYRHD
ncbi:hypothetical protein D3C71_1835430 [compost metagenome]